MLIVACRVCRREFDRAQASAIGNVFPVCASCEPALQREVHDLLLDHLASNPSLHAEITRRAARRLGVAV